MTSGSTTPQGSPASGLSSEQTGDMDDFGDFSQGPSFPGQGGNDGVFSVFQQAAQPTGQFGGVLLTDRSINLATDFIIMFYSLTSYNLSENGRVQEAAVNFKPRESD